MPTRFIVPQFIEEESKILWFVTVRQFVIIMAAVVFEVILMRIVGPLSPVFLGSLLLVAVPALVFSFVKVNGQNFHIFLLNIITSFKKPQLRIWHKQVSFEEIKLEMERFKNKMKEEPIQKIIKQKPTSSRLAELSLIVDTGGIYKGENNE